MWLQSWYFRNCENLHIKWRLGHFCTTLHASSLCGSVSFFRFTCRVWPSLVGCDQSVTHLIRKKKKRKNFFEWSLYAFLRNFAPEKIFRYSIHRCHQKSYQTFIALNMFRVWNLSSEIAGCTFMLPNAITKFVYLNKLLDIHLFVVSKLSITVIWCYKEKACWCHLVVRLRSCKKIG